MRTLLTVSGILLLGASAAAQDEARLKRAFEGASVTVRMDMPATSDGVDVSPLAANPVDYGDVADHIRRYGVGVHQGESITVTKVKVHGDHIEFHLGGGGFGTFSDRMAVAAASSPTVLYEGKTRRERDLEQDLRYTSSRRVREDIKDEISDLRRERLRDNAVAATLNAQNRRDAQALEEDRRAQSGSRFNIRYPDRLPPDALTEDGVMDALARYVDFDNGLAPGPSRFDDDPDPTGGSPGPALRKGLTVVQVEQILGPAVDVRQRSEGAIEMTVREYDTEDGQEVTTQFVGGVLIDYTIRPAGR